MKLHASLATLLPRFLLVAMAYYLSGRIGLSLASHGGQVTLIWPPTGIALFALLTWGARIWPAIWLAAFAINLPLGPSLAGALVIASGNTLGPRWLCDEWVSTTVSTRRTMSLSISATA